MTEVTAYLADDGKLYGSPEDARRADLAILKAQLLASLGRADSLPSADSIDQEYQRIQTLLAATRDRLSISTSQPTITP